MQYCKFLCGKRYLISCGIDGLLFLFDLVEWQSVAYLKHESCISMAISPNGNKIVCLESSGQMSVIGLRGLQSDLITNLELPLQANHEPRRECLVPSLVPEAEADPYLIPGDYLASSGSSDEYESEDEMDITSELSFKSF